MTDGATAPSAARPTPPPSVPAPDRPWLVGRRDVRLDVLRGFALFAMAVNHAGLSTSYVHTVTGRGQGLISAAEVFLVVSGLTLGMVTRAETAERATARVVRRSGEVWLGAVGIALALALMAQLTVLRPWYGWEEPLVGEDRWRFVVDVLALRTEVGGTAILVFYVVMLLAAVPVVVLLHRGRTWLVVGGIAAVWLVSQVQPWAVELPVASFRSVAANAPLLLGGLVVGHHHREISSWWRRRPWSPAVDVATVVAAVGLIVLHAADYPGVPWLREALGGDDPLGVREFEMPWAPLLVVAVVLRALWLLVTWGWPVVSRTVGPPLTVLGRAALITFGAHLVAIPVLYATPGFPGAEADLPRWLATVWVTWFLVLLVVPVLAVREAKRRVTAAGPRVRAAARHLPAALVVTLAVAVATLPAAV